MDSTRTHIGRKERQEVECSACHGKGRGEEDTNEDRIELQVLGTRIALEGSDNIDGYQSADDGSENRGEDERQIAEAMSEFMDALDEDRARRSAVDGTVSNVEEGNAGDATVEDETDRHLEGSDSSDDEVLSRNTIGSVPLEWYKDEEHIGYDIGGRKLKKREKKDQLDSFLARSNDSKDWSFSIWDVF